jgi:hypothetical protein
MYDLDCAAATVAPTEKTRKHTIVRIILSFCCVKIKIISETISQRFLLSFRMYPNSIELGIAASSAKI